MACRTVDGIRAFRGASIAGASSVAADRILCTPRVPGYPFHLEHEEREEQLFVDRQSFLYCS